MIASEVTPKTGRSAGRFGLIVTGALAGALALALFAGGGALVWAHGAKQDGDGYYAGGAKHLTTPTYALASEGLDVGVDGPDSLFRDGHLGTVRVSATGTRAHPIFVGIARKSQVASYLGSVSHDALTDFEVDPFSVTYARRAGHKVPSAPSAQTFWAAKASGTGRQTMSWPVAKGDWAVVIMNADGSRGVHTNVSVAAKMPFLLKLGVGLLVGGGVAAAGAGVAIRLGASNGAIHSSR
jgi:hypothetical protein